MRRLDSSLQCPQCGRSVPTYFTACEFCGGELASVDTEADDILGFIVVTYFAGQWDKSQAKKDILTHLTKHGCEEETAQKLMDKTVATHMEHTGAVHDTPEGRQASRADAVRQLWISLIWIVAGGGISIIATVSGSFLFFIWYGPVLYGLVKLVKSLIMLWAVSERHAT
jgi:hypothetical protein